MEAQLSNSEVIADMEKRLSRLEAHSAIRNLAAKYTFAIDDRDLDAIGECFAENARFYSRDGVMDAVGRKAIVDQFYGRFSVLGHGAHYSHDHVIWVDEDDPHKARGLVSLHAELIRKGKPMLASLRYYDRYIVEDGAWRFLERELAFLYYLDTADYVAVFSSTDRNRAYDEPAPADFPEALPTWRQYHDKV
jgi:ketosteroid isomerase-like protein